MLYRKYFTLGSESSFTSLFLSHFSHTDPVTLGLNGLAWWTIGNHHAKKLGCRHLVTVSGLGCALASTFAFIHLRSHNTNNVIAGATAANASLITYNAIRNPQMFSYARVNPYAWVALLAFYGVYNDDKAALGGVAGGYLAFLLAL